MSPSDIAEVAPAPWVLPWRDPELGVRTAVALEHNCPLEGVTVLVARESGASVRFTVRACGVERVYQEFEDLGFIDVSRAVASAIVPEIAPPIAPLPTPPNTNPNSPAAPDVTPPNAPGSAPSPSPSEPKR